jgi:hypothetical protein
MMRFRRFGSQPGEGQARVAHVSRRPLSRLEVHSTEAKQLIENRKQNRWLADAAANPATPTIFLST